MRKASEDDENVNGKLVAYIFLCFFYAFFLRAKEKQCVEQYGEKQ